MSLRGFIKDNYEEFLWGALLGLGFAWIIGWEAILLSLITGCLWRLGGAGWLGTKLWRRLGVPVSIAIVYTSPFITLTIGCLLTFGLLSIGYGSRSAQPPDPGSPLGNLWLRVLGNEDRAKIASRLTIIIAVWLVWSLAYITKGV